MSAGTIESNAKKENVIWKNTKRIIKKRNAKKKSTIGTIVATIRTIIRGKYTFVIIDWFAMSELLTSCKEVEK